MTPAGVPALDDVSRCPLGVRCEACGSEGEDGEGLAVATAAAGPLGVLCLTLCPRCAAAECAPPVAVATAVRLVGQHARHLGIDVDVMAAALAARRGGP